MANHLIIGLGGTGGKVIREFRKRVYEEFRSIDPGNGVFVDYVYVDSSPEDLNDRSGWKVLGKSVHLSDGQKVNINGIGTTVLDNIKMYPGLEAFLTPADVRMMKEKMGPLISAGIGGQRRRLGRTLLANNMADKNNPRNFEAVVRGAVGRLQSASGDTDVTFHICAGMAGGTGSGSIIDAVSLIRTWFPYNPDTKAFKIRLMVYMPEQTMVQQKHDAGFYQANGYAALSELNALSVGSYKPVDIKGETNPFSGKVQRLLDGQEPFEACYIYSNVNERGKVLDLSQGLPKVVADFLFQTTVAAYSPGRNGQLGRLVGCENDGAGPEMDRSGKPTRSRKFLSFGITRVSYPEAEIREYVIYSFAMQVALQLTYNYWIEGQGYGTRTLDEVGSGYTEEIKSPKNRGDLMLDNARLMLSTAIIDNDSTSKWHDIDGTWTSRIAREVEDVMKTVSDKKLWVNTLTERCKVFYDSDFRNQGVKAFYTNQQKEIKAYAKFIRRHIENKLFTEWSTGLKSMFEIEKYLAILMQDCTERVAKFNPQKSNLINDELPRIIAEMQDVKREYDNINWLRDAITGATGRVLGKYQTAICNYYITATRIEAYEYAKMLMQEIVLELSKMRDGVEAFHNRVNDINIVVTQQAESKCRTHDEQSDAYVKKYDPEKVRAIVRQYTSNKEYQENASQKVRDALLASLGQDGERSFVNLYDKTDLNLVTDTILDICTEVAVVAMDETAKSDPLSKMVGVNILDKLKQELTNDDRMEAFVKQIINSSASYVQFNSQEKSKDTTGSTGAMMSMLQLSIPKPDESQQAFYNQLIKAFQAAIPGFSPSDDVAEHYKSNEIVAISANSGFPLRYLSNMTVLKDKYDKLVNAPGGEFNRMVLHTESFSDINKVIPSLYEMDSLTIKKVILPILMLAYALGLIEEQQDPVTGERFSAMKGKDAFGNDKWLPLGKDFGQIWEALGQDYGKAMDLKDKVDETLAAQVRSNEQKAVVKQALGNVLQNQVKGSLCEGNQFHPDYAGYEKVAVAILDNELKEL